MIDGSERCNGWLNLELQSPHIIERRSKFGLLTQAMFAYAQVFRSLKLSWSHSTRLRTAVRNCEKTGTSKRLWDCLGKRMGIVLTNKCIFGIFPGKRNSCYFLYN